MALVCLVTALAWGCDDSGGSSGDTGVDGGAGGAGGAGGDGGDGGATCGMGGMGGEGGVVGCDPACAPDEVCQAGACVMADPCAGVACEGDTPVCFEGGCVACNVMSDCAEGEACDDHACVVLGCSADMPCGEGTQCIAGTCEPDFDCAAEDRGMCPGGLSCVDGECSGVAPGETCMDASQCLFGETCRSDRPRYCGPCLADADCPGSQTCALDGERRVCAEAACVDDVDCIGARVCDGGRCAQPLCDDDDDFEGNDDFASAAQIMPGWTYGGLVSCDDDWYVFDIPPGVVATAWIRQRDAGANLDIAFYNAAQAERGRGASGRATEAVIIGPYPSARPIYLRVFQDGPESKAAYDLQVDFAPDGECVEDPLEIGSGDDTRATATYLRRPGDVGFSGPVEGRICVEDVDYMCFQLNARETLTITGRVSSGTANIEAVLYNGNDEAVQMATWTRANSPEIRHTGAQGTYCLALTGASGAGAYQISFSVVDPNSQRICRAAVAFDLDEGVGSAAGQLPRDASAMSPNCATVAADGGEKAYTVNIRNQSLVVVRATGQAGGTLGDPVVSMRETCELAETEMACSTGHVEPENPLFAAPSPAELRVPVLVPGSYTILVDGTGVGDDPDFRLEVETRPLAGVPQNDACASAQALNLVDGVAEVITSLDQASNTQDTCVGNGGPDAFYTLMLDAPARVTAQATAQRDEFTVGVVLLNGCGQMPTRCGFGLDAVLPAGRHILMIDGANANARGPVTLQVAVELGGQGIANETCASPEALAPAGGTLAATTVGATNDYALAPRNRCTGFNSSGGDVVYSLEVDAGSRYFVQAVPMFGWDLSLYVVSNCADPASACQVGHDGALTETVVFDAAANGSLFVIVDGSNEESGDFMLHWGEAECADDAECGDGVSCIGFACIDD